MEFMRWEWLKVIHGHFSRLSSCCKKSKHGSEEDVTAEERLPLNNRTEASCHNTPTKTQNGELSASMFMLVLKICSRSCPLLANGQITLSSK